MTENLFDKMASEYDQMVQEADRENQFPFAGYNELMNVIAGIISDETQLAKAKILDLGVGTGTLYQKLPPEKYALYAMDSSEKMLDIARLRLPDANLAQADFCLGLPDDFNKEKYDFIVATYAFHHLDIEHFVDMVEYLIPHLLPYGKILIGDIMFTNFREKEQCHQKCAELWDETEHYHVFSQLIEVMDGSLALSFMKISYCAGVMIVDNYGESALQIDDYLIKYNSNTVKWKSSQSGKKASGRRVQVSQKER